MKKLFVTLFVFMFGVLLIGCNKTTTETPTTLAPTTEAPTTEAPTTAVPDAMLEEMYEGSHTVSAMGSEVVYMYEITFVDGDYYFVSEFEMGGEAYTFEETGTYSVSGNTITMTPEGGEAVEGEYLGDGVISISIKASEMASRSLKELTALEVDRLYVGTHTVSAMGSEVVYVYEMIFAYGIYTFISEFEMGGEVYNYFEIGTYEVDGTEITITPMGEDAVTGTVEDGTLTISVKASAMASRSERELSSTKLGIYYEGTHTVSAMGSEVVYNYTIKFINGEYFFVSNFTMSETDYTYEETGTYAVDGLIVTLTPAGGEAVTGSINMDWSLTLPIKASEMGSRADRELTMTIPMPEVE